MQLLLLAFCLLGAVITAWYQGEIHLPKQNINRQDWTFSIGELAALFVGSLGLLFTFVACFSPITYYDSLVYHLALPSIYLRQGSLAVVPYNLYSFFPGLMEMLYLFVMRFSKTADSVINLVGLSMSAGIVLVLIEWAYELRGRKTAILVFLLWWTCPAILFLSLGAYVDVPLAFWELLSVRFFDIALRDEGNELFLLSGLFAGFGFATKYTGAAQIVLLCGFLIFLKLHHRINSFKKMNFFLFGASIAPLPWLLKNWLAVGNPIFPFAYRFLGTGDVWTLSSAAHYFRILTEYDHTSQLADWLIRTPLLLLNQPIKFGGGFDVLGDFGWPLFLMALPFSFFQRKMGPMRWMTTYSLLAVLAWYFSKPVLRFLIPILPLLVLLTSLIVSDLLDLGRWQKFIVFFCVMPWLISNMFLYFLFANDLKLFDVAMGISSRQEFLNRRLTYESVYEFINEHLLNSDRVFLLGEQRTYGLERPFSSSNLFAETPLASICNQASSDDDILRYFRMNKITHLLTSESEILRLGGLNAFGFNEHGATQLRHFMSDDTLMTFENRSVKLVRINY